MYYENIKILIYIYVNVISIWLNLNYNKGGNLNSYLITVLLLVNNIYLCFKQIRKIYLFLYLIKYYAVTMSCIILEKLHHVLSIFFKKGTKV